VIDEDNKIKSEITFRYVFRPGITSTIPEEFQRLANNSMNRDE
jgi:hypothetical protein